MSRKDGQIKGGITHSQKIYWCELCQQPGQGARFKQHHVDTQQCNGRGVKNYYSRMRLRRFKDLF